eukprot:EG_transcript_20558
MRKTGSPALLSIIFFNSPSPVSSAPSSRPTIDVQEVDVPTIDAVAVSIPVSSPSNPAWISQPSNNPRHQWIRPRLPRSLGGLFRPRAVHSMLKSHTNSTKGLRSPTCTRS